MTSRLTAPQHEQLLKAINPNRVGKDRNKRSHVEAYEIRAHLNRLFGFAGWSQRVLSMDPIFEAVTEDEKDKKVKVTVAYRAHVELTVCAEDGTALAVYSEWATGDAQNFPVTSRGDAHDFAIKTAESQGLKRCAMNLGDQFGLSLYRQGSTQALVGRTLVGPSGVPPEQQGAPVDQHIAAPLPAESEVVEDKRERSAPTAPPTPSPDKDVDHYRKLALSPPKNANHQWWARLQLEAAAVLKLQTTDAAGTSMTLGALIQNQMKVRAA